MDGWPVMLNVRGRRAVVVGGGPVATRRAKALQGAGAQVTVISPRVTDELDSTASLTILRRTYARGDVAGAWLVVAATDDAGVNAQVAADAAAAGALVNRCDDPEHSDVVALASGRRGPVTVAVHSGQVSAAAAAAIRDELLASLREEWVALLTIAAPYRTIIQARIDQPDQRQQRLRALASEAALAVWRRDGEAGLRQWCEALADPNTPIPSEREMRCRAE